MSDSKIMSAVQAGLLAEMPDLQITPKAASLAWRALGALMFFNKNFMTMFFTTIRRHVYAPSSYAPSDWGSIAHEGVHARDDHAHPVWFKVSYLFPQLLAPLALLALGALWGSHWWLLAVLFLVVLPLPSPGRVRWERRAYLMTMCCDVAGGDLTAITNPAYQQWMIDTYCGSNYAWMSWSRRRTALAVDADTQRALAIADGRLVLEPYTSTVALVRAAG